MQWCKGSTFNQTQLKGPASIPGCPKGLSLLKKIVNQPNWKIQFLSYIFLCFSKFIYLDDD